MGTAVIEMIMIIYSKRIISQDQGQIFQIPPLHHKSLEVIFIKTHIYIYIYINPSVR